jgi:hypothetical protein
MKRICSLTLAGCLALIIAGDRHQIGAQSADKEPPAGPRIRLPSADVNQPVPLPVLARSVPGRAPLDDPTADLSRAAAVAAPLPVRTQPLPFRRLNLPDPFELRDAVRLRNPPAEDPLPPSSAARPPRP